MTIHTLNKVMVDWLTLTSFRDEIYKLGVHLQNTHGGEKVDAKVMQYAGRMVDTMYGHIFAGTGHQKGMYHNMVRLSGQTADDALTAVSDVFQPYQDNVTRIDFQITIMEPDGWSQWDMLTRLRKKGEMVGWVASRDKGTGYELATVYIGNRASSPRFVRVYQKLTDDGEKLLRLEVEIKRQRAREHGKYIHEYAKGDRQKAIDEVKLMSQKDFRLELAFGSYLEGWGKPITVGRHDTNTAAWIRDQCLPAIAKYVNDHNSNHVGEILSAMKLIIENSER